MSMKNDKSWSYRDLLWNTSGVLPITRVYWKDCGLAGLGWLVSMIIVLLGVYSLISGVFLIVGLIALFIGSKHHVDGVIRDMPIIISGCLPALLYGMLIFRKRLTGVLKKEYNKKLKEL